MDIKVLKRVFLSQNSSLQMSLILPEKIQIKSQSKMTPKATDAPINLKNSNENLLKPHRS